MERVKFSKEYIFRASPTILYKFLITPDGLIRWFCDEVHIQGDTFLFGWEGSEEEVELIEDVEDELLRFHREDADEETEYYEYALSRSPVTGETILIITDYCDDDEVTDQIQLWDTLMERLRSVTGG